MQAWQATVQDDRGNAVPNPVVTVYEDDGVTEAAIFDELGVALPNPLTGNIDGFVQFWAGPGQYLIEGSGDTWAVDLGALEVAELASAWAFRYANVAAARTGGVLTPVTSITTRDGLAFREAPSDSLYFAFQTPDNRKWWPAGWTSPEHFEAVGNGSSASPTDDAAKIQMMFDCIGPSGVGEVRFDMRKEYGIGSPVVTTARFSCSTGMRFVGLGTRPAYADTLINFNANVKIASIEVRLAAGANWQRVLRPGRGSIGNIVVTAPARISGYEDAAGGAVTFSADSNTDVGFISVTNFDNAVSVREMEYIRIAGLLTQGCLRGIRVSNSNYVNIGAHTHTGRIVPWDEVSGAYAQDLENVKYFYCGNADVRDTMSHGIRVSGQTDYASQYLTWGTARIRGAGRCGFKLQGAANDTTDGSGGAVTWISDVTIGELYVSDAGRVSDEYLVSNGGVGEFSDNGTGPNGGANEYGISLIKSRRVQIGKFVCRKVNNTYASASAGASIRSCKEINIHADIDSAYYYGIKFGASEETLDSIHITGNISRTGTFTDNTTDAPGTAAHSRGYGWWAWGGSVTVMTDWMLDLTITDSRRGFYHRCTSFPRANIIQGVMARNFSGADDNAPTSNQYLNLSTSYSPRT